MKHVFSSLSQNLYIRFSVSFLHVARGFYSLKTDVAYSPVRELLLQELFAEISLYP